MTTLNPSTTGSAVSSTSPADKIAQTTTTIQKSANHEVALALAKATKLS